VASVAGGAVRSSFCEIEVAGLAPQCCRVSAAASGFAANSKIADNDLTVMLGEMIKTFPFPFDGWIRSAMWVWGDAPDSNFADRTYTLSNRRHGMFEVPAVLRQATVARRTARPFRRTTDRIFALFPGGRPPVHELRPTSSRTIPHMRQEKLRQRITNTNGY